MLHALRMQHGGTGGLPGGDPARSRASSPPAPRSVGDVGAPTLTCGSPEDTSGPYQSLRTAQSLLQTVYSSEARRDLLTDPGSCCTVL